MASLDSASSSILLGEENKFLLGFLFRARQEEKLRVGTYPHESLEEGCRIDAVFFLCALYIPQASCLDLLRVESRGVKCNKTICMFFIVKAAQRDQFDQGPLYI